MEKTYNVSEAAKKIGVSVKTLQRWDRDGKLVASRTPSNRRYYADSQLAKIMEGENYMEIVSGWQVFSKEEMNNDNAIKVFSDMIQNFDNDIPKWKEDCGMRKLLECQRNACYKAIAALSIAVE